MCIHTHSAIRGATMDPELVRRPRTLVGLRLNVDMPNAGRARAPVGLQVCIPVQHPLHGLTHSHKSLREGFGHFLLEGLRGLADDAVVRDAAKVARDHCKEGVDVLVCVPDKQEAEVDVCCVVVVNQHAEKQ